MVTDDGATGYDDSAFADSAPHCDSGPCAASVDTGSKIVRPIVTSLFLPLYLPGTGAPVPPLLKPPKLLPAVG